ETSDTEFSDEPLLNSNDSASGSLPKAVARYETSLSEAALNCKKNYKFDLLDLLTTSTKSNQCMLGIDEAGRGPVLGPMVYACALSPISRLNELKTIGLADSKTLNENQRDKLLKEMLNKCDWISAVVHVISPVYITEKMLDKSKTSLNAISHDSAIQLIQSVLDSGVNLVEVYVDTVGKAEHYQTKLQNLFPQLKIRVESKADDIYPIVSAASIFAKVCCYCSKIHVTFFQNFYEDPVTKSYLRACMDPIFGFPSLVRSSWSTASSLLDQHGVSVRWEDDETHEEVIQAKKLARKREHSKGTCKLSNYFNNAQSRSSTPDALQRQPFFVRTGLVHVQTIT
ncbi:ribonuclease H2 subunit A, partial [Schistosoma bovis]